MQGHRRGVVRMKPSTFFNGAFIATMVAAPFLSIMSTVNRYERHELENRVVWMDKRNPQCMAVESKDFHVTTPILYCDKDKNGTLDEGVYLIPGKRAPTLLHVTAANHPDWLAEANDLYRKVHH